VLITLHLMSVYDMGVIVKQLALSALCCYLIMSELEEIILSAELVRVKFKLVSRSMLKVIETDYATKSLRDCQPVAYLRGLVPSCPFLVWEKIILGVFKLKLVEFVGEFS